VAALSKSSIVARIRSGELVVSPILSAEQLGISSIDLRMGTVALMARAGAQSHVDPVSYRDETTAPSAHDQIRRRQQKHERFDVPFGSSFLLHPGSLVLVPTFEWVRLPRDLQGIVTARSSWAREGLNIATATIINPGYRGIVTLELANFGEIPITLYPGLRLAQLALHTLLSDNPDADGDVNSGQFDLSFEPSAGNIAQDDEVFLPALPRKTTAVPRL
jgi:dCTP deaminase